MASSGWQGRSELQRGTFVKLHRHTTSTKLPWLMDAAAAVPSNELSVYKTSSGRAESGRGPMEQEPQPQHASSLNK